MKIVECINQVSLEEARLHGALTVAIKGEYYTIRGIVEDSFFLFEEIYFGRLSNGVEIGMHSRGFREIQFPPSLEAEIKECLTREFQTI